MSELKRIRKPIEKELIVFEKHFKDSMKSNVPLLGIITNYILRRKGKQMRPTFVLLTSGMFGEITPSTYTAATLIELLHTASLIHDDVVDESYERRGFFSLNALWRSKIAVLVGDFLLSKGLLLSVEKKEYELLEIVSEAVKQMSEGELLQIRKARKLDITMDEYFTIIEKKTAALIAACTACGAKAAGQSDEVVKKFHDFGSNVGIAFQIKDDLFDYQRVGGLGKPVANDIKEKKMTLPLIYALRKAGNSESRKVIRMIRKKSRLASSVDKIIDFVIKHGGLEYAHEKMDEYKNRAIHILDDFPESESKKSLIDLVNFTVTRKK
jgi:octaprenyl-diphosphate synthase